MIKLIGLQPCYEPNQVFEFEYRLSKICLDSVVAIESSIVWSTEGKGTEDLGVHFFQRVSGISIAETDWCQPHRVQSVLPGSPLSYEGKLLKIRWSVRVRVFLDNGEEILTQKPFYLGALTREV